MQYEKIDPSLLVALKDYKSEGIDGAKRHIRSLGLIHKPAAENPLRTAAILQCDPKANLEHLSDFGIKVNQAEGRIRTAFLPLQSVEALSNDPGIQRIIAPHRMKPFLDVAPGKEHIPEFRNKTGLTGKGVIVGIVDTGVDGEHPYFKGRILKVWDQEAFGDGVKEGAYGMELGPSQIASSRDSEGHGTHVAGIAAGKNDTYGGVASGADFVVVRTKFYDNNIIDGINYVFRVAGELNRPAVVNLSLGGHSDPHDGTDIFSQFVDEISGPGRIVCCAAGNSGEDDIHSQTSMTQGTDCKIPFHVPLVPMQDIAMKNVYLNCWYSGKDKVEVAIQSPGDFITDYQAIIEEGDPLRTHELPDGIVDIATPGTDPRNNDNQIQVIVKPRKQYPVITPGTWNILLRGAEINNGRVDMWIMDDGDGDYTAYFKGESVTHSCLIGSPGASGKAITVGSFTTKNQWTDIQGKTEKVGFDLDTITGFSSQGPLRNEKEKPDLLSAGAMIASALSHDADMNPAYIVDKYTCMMCGTSMAAPMVTGIVALLLERDPQLDSEMAKAFLRGYSSIPNIGQGTFDPSWGFGLVDLLEKQ